MSQREEHIEQFYTLLDELSAKIGGTLLLKDCDGKVNWAKKQGVYFFYEQGEYRKNSDSPRIVRIGTHAVSAGIKSTLWGRLHKHRGRKDGTSGNHRKSVFRRHVGASIIQRDNLQGKYPHWEVKPAPKAVRKSEQPLEQQVSAHIGNMPFLWLEVDDEPSKTSDRSVIEKNSIAMLSGAGAFDPPSQNWLGLHSDREIIPTSGLWNVNYVGIAEKPVPYDANFLAVFKTYLDKMEQR